MSELDLPSAPPVASVPFPAIETRVETASAFDPIFIGGMPRSGTTLLRAILDSHPNIACGPELRAIPALAQLSAQTRALMGERLQVSYYLPAPELDSVFADLIRSFLAPLKEARAKKRIAEKTPANALHFGELARLFPDAAFIQIIRDGRDAVSSVLGMDWKDARTGARLPITTDPAIAASAWVQHIENGRRARAAGVRYFEIRYEDIVARPKAALSPLFAFLGEDWSDEVLAFHANENTRAGENEASAAQVSRPLYRDSVGRWRNELPGFAREAVRREAGDMLIELGYASSAAW